MMQNLGQQILQQNDLENIYEIKNCKIIDSNISLQFFIYDYINFYFNKITRFDILINVTFNILHNYRTNDDLLETCTS